MHPHMRIARPTSDLILAARMYQVGLGLELLGSFQNHEGFDGVMLGHLGCPYHLEFTSCRGHLVAPSPTEEDLVVFFYPDPREWGDVCRQMTSAGFKPTANSNPYWEANGKTFADLDGYRVVIQNAAWE